MSDWGREQPAILAVHSWLEVQLMPVTGCVGGLSHHLATPWLGANRSRPLNCTKDSFQLILEWLHLCKDQCTEHFGSRWQLCSSFANWWLWVRFVTAQSSGWVEVSQRWYPEPCIRNFKPLATANLLQCFHFPKPPNCPEVGLRYGFGNVAFYTEEDFCISLVCANHLAQMIYKHLQSFHFICTFQI